MSDTPPRPRRSKAKNTYTTRTGKTLKLNRSLSDRMKAGKEARARRKAAYLSTLPKEPWKRILYRLKPKRLFQYWFSREGLIMALKISGVTFVVIFLLIVGLFAYFRKDLPKIKDINSSNSGGSIAYYDRTGQTLLFQDYDAFKRIPVTGDNMSTYIKEATVAVEDKDFYHEGAFNVKGITRAAINNATGGSTQGGSTITQQLVKLNEGWTDDHTVNRKVKELILAVELEREYSKSDILAAYLNLAPYSGLDNGVQAAANDYFHEDASQLTLAQSALLAAIPKSPGVYSPFASPNWNPLIAASDNYFDSNGLIARQQYILDLMAKQGYISQSQANTAKKVNILAQVQQMPSSHYAGMKPGFAYAVLSAKAELAKDFPASVIKSGGWKVITTFDVNLQNLANKALSDNAAKLHADQADDAAFVAEDNSTGQVVSLVGGMDFTTQQLNFASESPISPGSSIKPYSYATLINDNNNVGAGSMLGDTQSALPGYACTNKNSPDLTTNPGNCLFDDTRKYSGNVSIRYALGNSLNVPAVKAFTSSDPSDTSTAADGSSWRLASIKNTMSSINTMMGQSDAYHCFLPGTVISAAVPADETQCYSGAGIGNEAYTTLANHVNGLATLARVGQVIPQTMILKVTNASNKVLEQFTQPKPKQVLKQDSAYIVDNMASDPGASYLALYGGSCTTTNCTGGYRFQRYKGWQNAIKTGTNEDLDGLMMSWNTKYTAGVWIGNYDRSAYGGTPEKITDPIMKTWMEGAIDNLGNVTPANWTQPSDIKTLASYRSAVPFSNESTPSSTDIYPSWYVGEVSGSATQTIDKVSGLVATSCTPADARQTASGSTSSTLNIDIFMDGHPNVLGGSSTSQTSSTPAATDNIHICNDMKPVVTVTVNSSTSCDNQTARVCNFTVTATQGTYALAGGTYTSSPAGTLSLLVNGQTVQTVNIDSSVGSPYPYTFSNISVNSGDTVQAQAIDSVLYTGTSNTVTMPTGTTTTPTVSH